MLPLTTQLKSIDAELARAAPRSAPEARFASALHIARNVERRGHRAFEKLDRTESGTGARRKALNQTPDAIVGVLRTDVSVQRATHATTIQPSGTRTRLHSARGLVWIRPVAVLSKNGRIGVRVPVSCAVSACITIQVRSGPICMNIDLRAWGQARRFVEGLSACCGPPDGLTVGWTPCDRVDSAPNTTVMSQLPKCGGGRSPNDVDRPPVRRPPASSRTARCQRDARQMARHASSSHRDQEERLNRRIACHVQG